MISTPEYVSFGRNFRIKFCPPVQYAAQRAATAAEISVIQAKGLGKELPRVSASVQEHKNKNRQAIGLHILQQAQLLNNNEPNH